MAHSKDEDQPWHNGSISGHAMGLLSGPKMQAMDDASKPAAPRVVEIPTGYTPGPWRIHSGDPWKIGGNESNPIAWVYPSNDADWDYRQARDSLADEHNARLIAIAPDLAAAYQAQQAEIERLRWALKSIIPLAESGAAKPSHGGPCGPFEYCDGDCVTAHYDNRALEKARSALTEPHSHE